MFGHLFQGRHHGKIRASRNKSTKVEELENRLLLSLLGQQIFPADYPWNQNISNAPVAANSANIITHIGSSIHIHPDWGEDSAANGASPLYGIPFNVVHGNTTAKINVVIDNYPGESDVVPVPIPANAVIEGDFQNGPNTNGAGYNKNQRGDSHLIVWDEDTDTAYELFGVSRPTDPTLFPNTNGVELAHTDGLWHAASETVWHMNTDNFRTLGDTSADAAGLSILAGLVRPDEGLTVAQGGQGAINHALRFTLPSGDVNAQYIYPASHVVNSGVSASNLPMGARMRLANTPAINTLISNMPPESQIIARAMQQYGLVLADIGSSMYVTGASASVNASNAIAQTWDINDILASNGLTTLTASDFQVVNLAPIVTGISASSGSAASTLTITGQNFSGAAGHISVFFGTTAATSVNVISDTQISVVVPSGTGTVDVTVQSGVNETDPNNPTDNVNAPIFGYGISATSAADKFTYGAVFTPVSISGQVFSDTNGDGAIQTGESGLSGWTVILMNGSTLVNSTTTNSTGSFTFTNVGSGTFAIKEVLQNNYFQTSPAGGSYNVTTASGQNITGENFGNFLVASANGSTLTVNLDHSAAMSIRTSASNVVVTLGGSNFSYANATSIIVASTTGGGTLNFDGPLTPAFTFSGNSSSDTIHIASGSMSFASSPTINLGSLIIDAGASAVMAGATSAQSQLTLGALSIASTGKLDIANNQVFLSYTATDPIGSVAAWIHSGYNNGTWTGAGITSTNAASNAASYGIGYADAADPGNPADLASGQIEIRYTLLGDANLDGKANGTDFAILATNFNQSTTSWDQGDFNYDSKANGSDFAFLATNFNQGISLGDVAIFTPADSIAHVLRKKSH